MNPFFVFRTLLAHELNLRMEELSVIASEKWTKLSKEERKIYYEVYEIVSQRYTIDNNANAYPFITLEFNPHVNGGNQAYSYERCKQVYDRLRELRSITQTIPYNPHKFMADPPACEIVIDNDPFVALEYTYVAEAPHEFVANPDIAYNYYKVLLDSNGNYYYLL